MNIQPQFGDVEMYGNQYRVYTERGWIICDTQKEVDEELDVLQNKNN